MIDKIKLLEMNVNGFLVLIRAFVDTLRKKKNIHFSEVNFIYNIS